MRSRTASTLLALSVVASAAPLHAQDVAAGKAAFTSCVACHGVDGGGNKALNAPAIAGQAAWYVARQLQNFKTGARGADPEDGFGAQMAPMAQLLATDADIQNVAAYLASLPAAQVQHDGGGDAAAGQALFATCVACHGADATGIEALNAPNLTLQQDWYLVRQLQNFKTGARGANPRDGFGAQMAPMAQLMADTQAMKDVAAYIASLR